MMGGEGVNFDAGQGNKRMVSVEARLGKGVVMVVVHVGVFSLV
jgi:hypothetical protein